MPASAVKPRWEQLAERFETLTAGPTAKQQQTAASLQITLGDEIPASVASVILQETIRDEVFECSPTVDGIPNRLVELENELDLEHAVLRTGTRAELRAWYAARYLLKTARGLRALQPEPGDVVQTHLGQRIISSVGDDGGIHFKGRGRSWPNYVTVVARTGSPGYEAVLARTQAALRNATVVTAANFAKFAPLQQYVVKSTVPSPEAVRALEEMLDLGEHYEEPLQQLLTAEPALLACLVLGNWRTYVIPKQALGGQYVTDFLVLGLNSLGPQWVAVELEAARHPITTTKGKLSQATRHAVDQINDWREWLTENVTHAQLELGLYGLTNRVRGMVVVGRDAPRAVRQAARARSEEADRISVRSWDWLARNARRFMEDSLHVSDVARGVAGELGYPTEPRQRSLQELEDDDVIDFDELLAAED